MFLTRSAVLVEGLTLTAMLILTSRGTVCGRYYGTLLSRWLSAYASPFQFADSVRRGLETSAGPAATAPTRHGMYGTISSPNGPVQLQLPRNSTIKGINCYGLLLGVQHAVNTETVTAKRDRQTHKRVQYVNCNAVATAHLGKVGELDVSEYPRNPIIKHMSSVYRSIHPFSLPTFKKLYKNTFFVCWGGIFYNAQGGTEFKSGAVYGPHQNLLKNRIVMCDGTKMKIDSGSGNRIKSRDQEIKNSTGTRIEARMRLEVEVEGCTRRPGRGATAALEPRIPEHFLPLPNHAKCFPPVPNAVIPLERESGRRREIKGDKKNTAKLPFSLRFVGGLVVDSVALASRDNGFDYDQRYPILTQKAANGLVTRLRAPMGNGDNLLASGSPARLPLEIAIKNGLWMRHE
ncbi:hypothetical protein EVAR_52684_1 [Eumeta japonica]|uniref:Uncharacterized protein n=1 Tax=Eumeta variegata TaxID=151549 RepID=A0A4C1Y3J6_EUMVA|nr:hypothetical protein EVAR_52684_1 [Eumeta japonica]